MILPIQDFKGNSDGEELFWEKCKLLLPNSFVSFHNYYLLLKQPDVIMLVPGKGVLIIEIKAFRASTIIGVPDNKTILRKNNPPDQSPLNQANTYRFQLIDNFLEPAGINSVYVIPAACYPYICENDFFNKKLDKISAREITFLQEDLETSSAFLGRIKTIFSRAYESINLPGLQKDGFDSALLEQVGNLISRDFRNVPVVDRTDGDSTTIFNEPPAPHSFNQVAKLEHYSVLVYSCDGSRFTNENIERYIAAWRNGTRIQLYSSNTEAVKRIKGKFESTIEDLDLSSYPEKTTAELKLKDGLAFRLQIDSVAACGDDFEILDGNGIGDHEQQLVWLDCFSIFNIGQFKMEHAPSENTIVKAGAGTGKTFSLISRINYLIWKEEIQPEDFPNQIAMITFTNDSASQMKEALTKNFLTYYLLTNKALYLEYIQAVEDAHISTIDSLARAILSEYSIKLGLGINFRIATGTYERAQLLRQSLDALLSAHPELTSQIPMTMFYFEQRLLQLMDKFDNKNIDLTDESVLFGQGEKQLPPVVLDTLIEVQQKLDQQMAENNAVCLGDLVRKLRLLVSQLQKSDLKEGMQIRYLFIDEFQDTDDVQIELIHAFQKLIGFKYFVVGDTKQCIYRFRGAEEKAFETLRNMEPDAPVYEVALQKNYRTDTGLLDRMNTIFSEWNKDKDLEYEGNDVLTGTRNYNNNPTFIMKEAESSGLDEELFIQTVKEAQQAAKGDGRVAILVRYNKQITEIQEICERHNISISTDVGGALFSSDPVIDLYKLLMALRYNQSPAFLYNLYTTSFVRSTLPKVELLGEGRKELIDRFYSDPPIKYWEHYLDDIRQEPVLKVIQSIIQYEKPWDVFARRSATIKEEQDRNRLYYIRNLDQLLENLVKIANTDYLTLNKLTDYLELMIVTRQEQNEREPFGVDAADGSLICTTVHKSKGAEYDSVIIPFCDFDISCKRERGTTDLIYSDHKVGYRILDQMRKEVFINDNYQDFQKDEVICRRHEETRILYVALTRAKRAIFYIVPSKNPAKKVTWASKLKEGQQ